MQMLNLFINTHLHEKTDKYRETIKDLTDNYLMESNRFFHNDNDDIYDKYMLFVQNTNILNKIQRIYLFCKRKFDHYKKIYGNDTSSDSDTSSDADNDSDSSETSKGNIITQNIDLKKLNTLLKQFNRLPKSNVQINNLDKYCDCGAKFQIEAKNSEYLCTSCGNTEKLYGVVFEYEQFFYQEGQRTKHGNYDSTKHCKLWLDRIQAKETKEIPKSVIDTIIKCIVRDNIWLESLDCPTIRGYLKETKLTMYNNNVPLIRRLITNISPDELTDHEMKLIYMYFSRITTIYNKIKEDKNPNCPYHPFFIYKIIEQIIPNKKRRDSILSCIHLQSRGTLIKHDNIWKVICEHIKEFEYKPTTTK